MYLSESLPGITLKYQAIWSVVSYNEGNDGGGDCSNNFKHKDQSAAKSYLFSWKESFKTKKK